MKFSAVSLSCLYLLVITIASSHASTLKSSSIIHDEADEGQGRFLKKTRVKHTEAPSQVQTTPTNTTMEDFSTYAIASANKLNPDAAKTFAFWTPEKIKAAVPLDADGTAPGGAGGVDPLTVFDDHWPFGGAVQRTVGRIFFLFPGGGPVYCSGTAVTDSTSGRSIILTAAHCVYDEFGTGFSNYGLFIPNQDDGYYDDTDWNCFNDPFGCWATAFGVVDQEWASFFNFDYDYAFYAVSDIGAHVGTALSDALDVAVGSLPIRFTAPTLGSNTYALGYPTDNDPLLRYCVDPLDDNGNQLSLPNCMLGGGSSGGPWIQPMDVTTGFGSIIGVNSNGPVAGAGMNSPKLFGTSAECLFNIVRTRNFASVVNRGVIVNPLVACPPSPPTVIFRDDFAGTSLAAARWSVDNDSEGRSTFGSTPIITGGMARLTFDTFRFKGTEIYTNNRFSRGTYGLEIEARIRFANPRPSGLVASFFTYYERASGAADGIETNFLAKQINKGAANTPINLETYDDFTGKEVLPYFSSKTAYVAGLNVGTWHIYVIRWLPGRTEWLVDGAVVASSTQAQPNANSNVCLSFWAAGSDWSEAYDKNFKPASNSGSNRRYYYDVDYVEVRQRNS
jgi:hypothetical protein